MARKSGRSKGPDLAKRRTGISATDIAALAGVAWDKTAWDVYQQKVNPQPEGPLGLSDPRRWGKYHETAILAVYAEFRGYPSLLHPGTIAHRWRRWQMATPDALVLKRNKIHHGVEAKAVGSHMEDQWGEPGTDAMPKEYLLQCQWGMSVTGAKAWEVPVLFTGKHEFAIYNTELDTELEEMLIELALDFMEKHLAPRIPPPVTYSDTAAEYVKRRWPRSIEPLRSADEAELGLARQLYAWRWLEGVAANLADTAELDLKSRIGDATGIEGEGWKITWKSAADWSKPDWEGEARMARLGLQAIASLKKARGGDLIEAAKGTLSEMDKLPPIVRQGARRFLPTLPPDLFHADGLRTIQEWQPRLAGPVDVEAKKE